MKIVHINASDRSGGAAIACLRHCEAMKKNGVEASVLVANKGGYTPWVKKFHLGFLFFKPLFYRVLHEKIVKKINPIGTFSIMKYGLPLYNEPLVKEADIIFIHWVNQNTLSIKGVEKILQLGKPTYWYMHDMFPITGGCHHSLGCDGYQKDCKNCPLINNATKKDLAKKQFTKKIKSWQKYSNLEFITPSKWLGDCVSKSKLASGHNVHVIPNVIDTELFKPLPFDTKVVFGLDTNKKTILFSADLSGSVYKGSQYTIECLKKLDPEKYEGLIIGNMPAGLQELIPMKVISTGYLSDALSLVIAYNACDTFLITSVAENYPNVVMEAMACGKPCLGFNTGGIPELINHKRNGYIAKNNTISELLDGFSFIFYADNYENLSNYAREQIVLNNSFDNSVSLYSNLI